MKETLQDLKTRRSCREYLDKQIDPKDLDAILEAGTCAPNGMGKQAAVMVAIQNKETIAKLSKWNAAVMGVQVDPFYGAPTIVVVLADKRVHSHVEDGALVMGNLLNAAHALGVDSCYVYRARQMFETEEGKALLKEWGLGEDYAGVGICLLGHGAEGGIAPAKPKKPNYIIKVQ